MMKKKFLNKDNELVNFRSVKSLEKKKLNLHKA